MSHDDARAGVLSGYDGRVLAAISVGWLAIRLGREAIPPLLPVIIDDVGISPSTAGVGLTAMWLVYALSQYPGGRLSDALSRKTVLTASLGVVVAGFVVLVGVTTYAGLLAGFVLVGLGAGLYFAPARALLADTFPHRRGQVFGIQSSAGSIGAAAAAGVTLVAISLGTWQYSFLPVVVVLTAVLVSLTLWHREAYVLKRVDLKLAGTSKRIFAGGRLPYLLLAYVLVSFSWQGFLGFLPTYLQAEKGFGQGLASGAFATVFIVAIVVGPLAGRLADSASRMVVGSVGILVGVCGLLVLVGSSVTALVVGGILLFAVGMRSFPPVMQAYIMGLFPDESMAGDFGAMKTIWTGLGSFAPAYVGFVAARESYGLAFGGLAACLLLSLAVLVYVHFLRTE